MQQTEHLEDDWPEDTSLYYDNISDRSSRADDFELFTHCVSVNTAAQVPYSLHEFRYVDYALDIANSDFSDDDDACSAEEPQVMTCELTTESVETCTAVPITAPQTFCPKMCTIDTPAFATATMQLFRLNQLSNLLKFVLIPSTLEDKSLQNLSSLPSTERLEQS